MNSRLLIITAIKTFVAWLLLSIAGLIWGNAIVGSLTPYYEEVIATVKQDFYPTVSLKENEKKGVTEIHLVATAKVPMPLDPNRMLPAGQSAESKATVLHALVPMVILATICVAFPVQNFKQRLSLIALSVPAMLVVITLTAPLQLLGNLEIWFLQNAAAAGYSRDKTWILEWTLLTEGGGRWLLPVLLGIGCGGISRRLFT